MLIQPNKLSKYPKLQTSKNYRKGSLLQSEAGSLEDPRE